MPNLPFIRTAAMKHTHSEDFQAVEDFHDPDRKTLFIYIINEHFSYYVDIWVYISIGADIKLPFDMSAYWLQSSESHEPNWRNVIGIYRGALLTQLCLCFLVIVWWTCMATDDTDAMFRCIHVAGCVETTTTYCVSILKCTHRATVAKAKGMLND